MGKNRGIVLLAVLLLFSGCATSGGDPYKRGVEKYGKGRIDEAIREYKEAALAHPGDPRPTFNLAVIYQDRGRLDEAETLYRAIVGQYPHHAPAWSNLASVQERLGRIGEAESSYRRAIESDRDDVWTVSQFGFFLLRAGRQAEAVAAFEDAIRINVRCSNAWYGLGTVAEQKGDQRAALQNYDKALMYNPADLEAYLHSVDIRLARSERGAAIGLLRKASDLAQQRGDISLLLGRLLREEGKLKDAEKALEQAGKNGAPAAECERELSIVYGRLSEEAAARAGAGAR